MKEKNIEFGGIIKHARGYGFKLTFDDTCTANQMKLLLLDMLKKKGYQVRNHHCYHDELTYEQEDLIINEIRGK